MRWAWSEIFFLWRAEGGTWKWGRESERLGLPANSARARLLSQRCKWDQGVAANTRSPVYSSARKAPLSLTHLPEYGSCTSAEAST